MKEDCARRGALRLLGTRRDFLAASFAAAAAQLAPAPLLAATKPECGLLVLGHADHGKTTLTAAMTKVQADRGLAEPVGYDKIDAAPVERAAGCRLRISRVALETDSRRYLLADCPDHADLVKAMIAGAAAMDGAILVVSAADGPMPQSREHIQLAAQAGVPAIVGYVNKIDLMNDPELLALVEIEFRQLLSRYGFPGDQVPIVKGSALAALEGRESEIGEMSIAALLKAIDETIPQPPNAFDRPFLMAIENVSLLDQGRTALTGRVERGIVKVGDRLEVVGLHETFAAICTGLEIGGTVASEGKAGDTMDVLFDGPEASGIERGQVLAAPGSMKAHRAFAAAVYFLSDAEGGARNPIANNYQPQLSFRTAELDGRVVLVQGSEIVMPGEHAAVEIAASLTVAMEKGLRFALREGDRTVGVGVVSGIIQ